MASSTLKARWQHH